MTPEDRELRLQYDLDEIRAGYLNRLWWALKERWLGNRHEAVKHLEMGLCRLTDTGPYAPEGQYDNSHPGWREDEVTARQVAWRRAAMPRSVPMITVQVAPIADAVTGP